jgi:squalene-hopene/tetraprenyl-beta-curcumene cyclase
VPLLVVMAKRPRARNPRGITIRELFVEAPELVRDWLKGPDDTFWARFFRTVDRVLQVAEPRFPAAGRAKAIDRAVVWVDERLNGEDGLGAIYPAMANAVMMYDVLGIPAEDPRPAIARASLRKLIVDGPDEAYVQPCLSPVWDTALAAHALLETGAPRAVRAAKDGLDWLVERQVKDIVGDYAARRPDAPAGGWAFQYANPHYPDLDDTAVVVMALDRADSDRFADSISRATPWVQALQSKGGGWAAFDADNTHFHLNHIPFADHGALLDPPTADVTARCLGMICQLGHAPAHPAVKRAVDWLLAEQEEDGSWFGRWGTNYIYGTWSALAGLNAAGVDLASPPIRRAVDWLLSKQRPDGSWGEDGGSYWRGEAPGEGKEGTASQTAWAMLALMAAGEVHHPAVARGAQWLMAQQTETGLWDEEWYTAVGFPRVFYLRYHGYRAFFPLWALARYRNLRPANDPKVCWGI